MKRKAEYRLHQPKRPHRIQFYNMALSPGESELVDYRAIQSVDEKFYGVPPFPRLFWGVAPEDNHGA